MKSGLISGQALSLVTGQMPRENQNQGLWQKQLEQASLWQTNLSITSFKSQYDLPQRDSHQNAQSEARHLQAEQLSTTGSKHLVEPSMDKHVQAAVASRTTVAGLHSVERHGQAVTAQAGALPQYSVEGAVAANKTDASLFSPRLKPLLTNARIWQKQHIFMSDIEGVKQLWIRDNTVTKGMTGKLAAGLLGSMSQLGVELNSVVVNGQLVFAKNHGIKE
ncbi:hypothetical protein [Methylophilus sp. Leaf408]|uniref:hypothetical protein n=1 Tax=Methylophilus sp. Leaf408 TaxID=2876561 RepID=UPI001E4BF620|nr:hypothetical protein [Methylophilus sp. Leaf408]